MTFKCRFNATCFLFKINRFVLIFSKTSNRFVLKICSGGFADYKRIFKPSLLSFNIPLALFFSNKTMKNRDHDVYLYLKHIRSKVCVHTEINGMTNRLLR